MCKILKQTGYFLIIIILLPYIITVFANGNEIIKSVSMSGNLLYVNVGEGEKSAKISLEEYGIGILAKEIDADVQIETIKAQAVLVRTSIYKEIYEKGSESVLTKEYWSKNQMKKNWGSGNYGENYEKMKKAWEETEGQVLMYEGKLALTPYHKLSNGKTRSGNEVFATKEYPYLMVKECPEDKESKDFMTISYITEKQVKIKNKDSAGYITEIECNGEIMSGELFREKYRLASACFVIQEFEENLRITAKGIGHGLGMSQYYANVLAEKNENYEQILTYFFEGTDLEEVAEIIVQ